MQRKPNKFLSTNEGRDQYEGGGGAEGIGFILKTCIGTGELDWTYVNWMDACENVRVFTYATHQIVA